MSTLVAWELPTYVTFYVLWRPVRLINGWLLWPLTGVLGCASWFVGDLIHAGRFHWPTKLKRP